MTAEQGARITDLMQDTGTELPPRSRLVVPSAPSATVRDALVADRPLRPVELGVLIPLLVALGVAAYGSYIQHAGFVTDDWSLQKTWLITTHGGQLSHAGSFISKFPGRPALGVYYTVVEAVLGFHQGMHLALALGWAILFSTSLYVLLRTLRLPALAAGIIAGLALIFPASDSLRLWAILGDGSYALTLLTLGAVLTLRSFDAEGHRRLALRGCGLALYALSVTTYEIGMLPLAISFVLYRCRVPWRRALRAWALDLVLAVSVYVLVTTHTLSTRLSTADTIHHALNIARDALKLMGATVLPFGGSGWVGVGLAAAVVAAAVLIMSRLTAGDPMRRELRRWLWVIVVASIFAAASYAIYAPGLTIYTPLAPGLGNRTNALSAPLLITIAYALGALLALLVFWRLRNGRRYAVFAAAFFGLVIGGFYFVDTRHDAATWNVAYGRGEQVLNQMKRLIPRLPSGSLVVSFGQPVQESPGIPIWATTWDLDGAVAMRYRDVSLSAMPGILGTVIRCGPRSAGPVNDLLPTLFSGADWRPYGKLVLFSTNGHWAVPHSRSECLRVGPTYLPGPWTAPNS